MKLNEYLAILEAEGGNALLQKIENILVIANNTDESLKAFRQSFGINIGVDQDKFYKETRSKLTNLIQLLTSLQTDINVTRNQ